MRTQRDIRNYYAAQGCKLMNAIEKRTGKMFGETHSRLEIDWYHAIDNWDKPRVIFLHNELCKEYDKLANPIED